MDKYFLNYQNTNALTQGAHPSWCEICEKFTKDTVIAVLKKHLYKPGEYTLQFRAFNGRIWRTKNQYLFSGWVTQKNAQIPEGFSLIGSIDFDYYDDTFENFDFKNTYPEIDCSKENVNATAKFTVAHENIYPSPQEFEIICEKSTERFMKRLHKAVNFPLEIACDYPDVIFEISYDCMAEQDLAEKTERVIEEYVAKYNKRHDEGIHYVANVTDITQNKIPNTVYIHVDFGECDIDALALVIKAIGKSDLPIKEITLT